MSDWDSPPPDWPFGRRTRRRALPGFGFDLDTLFEQMFRDMMADMPKEGHFTERKLPDGSTVRQSGPFVHGYSVTMGPDGKPIVREFGNVKTSSKRGMFGLPEAHLEPTEAREPLIDITDDKETIQVTAELPGVEKKDVKMTCADDMLTISVNTPSQKYHKDIQLPTVVNPDTPKATYNNGVLVITLQKTKPKQRGKDIQMM